MIIKVDLSNFVLNSKQFALIYIDFESMKTVADVIRHICTTFDLSDAVDARNYTLYEDIWYIPSNQPSNIFKDIKGIIRLFDNEEIVKNKECYTSALNSNEKVEVLPECSENIVIPDSKCNFSNKKNETCQQTKISDTNNDIVVAVMKENLSHADDTVNHVKKIILFNNVTGNYKKESIIHGDATASRIKENSSHDSNAINNKKNVSYDKNTVDYRKGNNAYPANCMMKILQDESSSKCEQRNVYVDNTSSYSNGNVSQDISVNCNEQKVLHDDSVNHRQKKVSHGDPMEIENNQDFFNDIHKQSVTYIDNDMTEEQFESNVIVGNPFCSVDESMNNVVKRKRKKKHHNRGKKLLKSNREEQMEVNINKSNILYENQQTNYEKCASYNFKYEKEVTQRVHKVFDSSEDESKPTLNQNSNWDSKDHIKFNSEENISSYKQSHDKLRYSKEKYKSDACIKEPTIKSFIETSTKLSGSFEDQLFYTKNSNSEPPVGCYDYPEPSEDIKLKFRNLLALEFRHKPKVFFKTRDNIGGYSQDHLDSWHSLPRSFASRKEKAINRNEEVISLNATLCKDPMIDNSLNTVANDIKKDDVSSDVNENTSLSTPSFTGIKPPKQRSRYMHSIGNTLSLLKGLNNPSFKKNKVNSTQSSPNYNSVSEIDSIKLGCISPITSSDNHQTTSQQLKNYPNLIGKEENFDNSDQNERLNVSHCQEQTYENNSSLSACKDEHLSDVNNSSTINVMSSEVNENNPDNVEEKISINESSEVCNIRNSEINEDTDLKNNLQQLKLTTNVKKSKFSNISFESYPLLLTLPTAGDIIATKLLSMDESLCPYYTEYRPAKVISIDGLKLNLQFLEDDNVEFTNNQESVIDIQEDELVTVDWRDLQSTRLVFP